MACGTRSTPAATGCSTRSWACFDFWSAGSFSDCSCCGSRPWGFSSCSSSCTHPARTPSRAPPAGSSSRRNAVAARICGKQCSPEQLTAVKARLHLDAPLPKQYWYFLFGYPGKDDPNGIRRNAGILHGDLGYSYINQQSVNTILKDAFPITLSLSIGSAVLWLFLGLSSGILSAIRPRSMLDRTFTFLALVFYSMPTFVLGLMLLLIFFYEFTIHGITIFPAQGYVPFTQDPYEWARHL